MSFEAHSPTRDLLSIVLILTSSPFFSGTVSLFKRAIYSLLLVCFKPFMFVACLVKYVMTSWPYCLTEFAVP